VPGYKVNVGFGLHAGYAFSGPIGSEFKIDATYFSHDVSLAGILEDASKTYKTKILFTGEF
jgi:class 3 adenylate cyclase